MTFDWNGLKNYAAHYGSRAYGVLDKAAIRVPSDCIGNPGRPQGSGRCPGWPQKLTEEALKGNKHDNRSRQSHVGHVDHVGHVSMQTLLPLARVI